MKNKGIWIGAVIALVLVIAVCYGSVKTSKRIGGNWIVEFGFGGSAKLRNTIELSKEEVGKLIFDYYTPNLNIYPTVGNTIIIEEYLRSDSESAKAVVSNQDGYTIVTGCKNIVINIGIWAGKSDYINIYLPEKEYEELSLYTRSGNIYMKEKVILHADRFTAEAVSGNIYWDSITAGSVDISSKSGNIECKNIEAKEALITGISGNVSCDSLKAENVKIKSVSGNIKMEEFTGAGKVKATSGNIVIKADELTGNIEASTQSGNTSINAEQADGNVSGQSTSGRVMINLKQISGNVFGQSTSGTVNLNIPRDLSFILDASTISGAISTPFDENLSFDKRKKQAKGSIGNNPTQTISLQSTSGNVSITY